MRVVGETIMHPQLKEVNGKFHNERRGPLPQLRHKESIKTLDKALEGSGLKWPSPAPGTVTFCEILLTPLFATLHASQHRQLSPRTSLPASAHCTIIIEVGDKTQSGNQRWLSEGAYFRCFYAGLKSFIRDHQQQDHEGAPAKFMIKVLRKHPSQCLG